MNGTSDARHGRDGASLPFWLTDLSAVPDDALSRALTLPLDTRLAGMARHWVKRTLTSWGLGDQANDAALIASELTANAMTHAHPDSPVVVLLLMFAAGTLRLEVRDHDPRNLPAPKTPAPDEVYGRGLVIVETIADRWGVRVTSGAKSVWSELDIDPTGSASDDGRPPDAG